MKLTVTYTSQGRVLEALLFLPPEGAKISDAAPALLFEGSMTGATQQVTEHLANELCEEGFVCMVLDHSYYSEDELAAQAWESPGKRIADVEAGLKFLSEQASTDEESIVGVGVSVGAEYLARAIENTSYCKGFIMVQSAFDDSQNFVGMVNVPTLVVNENNLDEAVEEIAMWVGELFQTPDVPQRYGLFVRVDWHISE